MAVNEKEVANFGKKEIDIRKEKREELIAKGYIPYKDKFDVTVSLKECMTMKEGEEVQIAGRITHRRMFGKFFFMVLQDFDGRMQISVSKKDIVKNEDDPIFADIKKYVDTGDFVGVKGTLYVTSTGELTVQVKEFTLLSKAIRSLPEKWNGLTDIETRYRQRYLDLISNEDSRKVFQFRNRFIQELREALYKNDFCEVETPILQKVASGAAAKPFITKHNALDIDLYLRIAPELFLKQLVAGGMTKVFEIGKNFRNEGIDHSHLQEFTMIEWYAAYWDYEKNIEFITKILRDIIKKTTGSLEVKYGDYVLDFGKEWERLDYCKKLNEVLGADILDFTELEDLKNHIRNKKLLEEEDIKNSKSIPVLIDTLYKRTIRPNIIQPTIVYNYPASLIPLARVNDKDHRRIDIFQLVVLGWEVVKSYSELVDPIIQREKFKEQAENKKQGDEETFDYDTDFVEAMEYGMPPISGLGMGIDRIVAILTNQEGLKDVIFFPINR